jgi:hypothetical protein
MSINLPPVSRISGLPAARPNHRNPWTPTLVHVSSAIRIRRMTSVELTQALDSKSVECQQPRTHRDNPTLSTTTILSTATSSARATIHNQCHHTHATTLYSESTTRASLSDLRSRGIARGQTNHAVDRRREHVSKSRSYSRSVVQPFPTDTQYRDATFVQTWSGSMNKKQ